MNPTLRRWIVLAVKLLIVAVVLWLVRGTMKQSWHYLVEHPRPLRPDWLALSGGLYLLALLPEGLFWHWALKALGQDVGLLETLRAYYIGHLGKYVPGKAMVIVLRTGLIHSHRVDTSIAVASVFLETLTMMAVGACIAVPVLAICFYAQPRLHRCRRGNGNRRRVADAAPGLLAAGAIAGRGPFVAGRGPEAGRLRLSHADLRLDGHGLRLGRDGYQPLGDASRAGLPGQLGAIWYLYTAIVAMAVVGGFASMIPGGLFAREAVFTGLLARLVGGDAIALIVAAALRLTWLLAELLISVILYPVRWVLSQRAGWQCPHVRDGSKP